jgi:hypothetical protein
MKTYYETLGLPINASLEAIRERLNFLLVEYANTGAELILLQAQTVLLDPLLRKQYDSSISVVERTPLPNLSLIEGLKKSDEPEPQTKSKNMDFGLLTKVYRNIRLVLMLAKLNFLWRFSKWFAFSLFLDLWFANKQFALFHIPILILCCLNGTLVYSFYRILNTLGLVTDELWPDDSALFAQCIAGFLMTALLAKAGWGIAFFLAISQFIAVLLTFNTMFSESSQTKAQRYKNFRWKDSA